MSAINRGRWLAQSLSLGIRADSLDVGVTFRSVADAESNARVLASTGIATSKYSTAIRTS